jgi:Skp family chaperone for outer membrane proteins
MEMAITAALAAGLAGALAWIAGGWSRGKSGGDGARAAFHEAERTTDETRAEEELRERRAEIVRLEERILQKEESLEARLSELAKRERSLIDRERDAERLTKDLRQARQDHLRELERVAGLTHAQAKQMLLQEVGRMPATSRPRSCARSKTKRAGTPTGGCAASSPSACSASRLDTLPRRPSRS